MANYIMLVAGEKLQAGDEYSTGNGWRQIPDFMVGDAIPDSPTTQWRREVSENQNIQPPKKTSFFAAIFGK